MSEEQERHRLLQSNHRDRLLDERFVLPQRVSVLEELIAVPGKVEDLRVGLASPEVLRQFVPAHPRHHHIHNEDVEGTRLCLYQAQGFRAVRGNHDLVTGETQRPFSELANGHFVIDDEHT